MMRTVLSFALVFLLAAADNHQGPRCYDGCYIFTEFAKTEGMGGKESLMDHLDEKFKKCGTDMIKYCAADETCNNFDGKAQLGAQFETSKQSPTDGVAIMKHYYCGGKTDTVDDNSPKCTGNTDSIKSTMISLSKPGIKGVGEFAITNLESVVLACQSMENCGEDCVDMEQHPDYDENKGKERHEPSSATTTNTTVLLLAAALLYFAM